MDVPEESSLEIEAAALLERVLDAVNTGSLDADGPAGRALVKRLEGALLALRALQASSTDTASEGVR